MDKNTDGRWSADELAKACNITLQQAQGIFMIYDYNGDGTLDPKKFKDLKDRELQIIWIQT